jgi:hypothetical protein
MSIIINGGHKQTAEVEFAGKHPDIFSSHLAAEFVKNVALKASEINALESLRMDINVQILASEPKNDITPIIVHIGGQITCDPSINLSEVAKQSVVILLKKARYLEFSVYSEDAIKIDLEGITVQSPNLNKTTMKNAFADSCVSYGHYVAKPYGLSGTFPSLIISQQVDQLIDRYAKEVNGELRSDGKVHVTVQYNEKGFTVADVYISVAHSKDIKQGWRDELKKYLIDNIANYGIEKAEFNVNSGGDFNVFFLDADAGVSKAKDDVIISGGIHQLGTDRVWGKCMFKASSTLIPYTFALSKIICDVTGAKFASVSGYSHYGQEKAFFDVQDLDPALENKRSAINTALANMTRDRDGIRQILDMPITKETYISYNDITFFHSSDKPWKKDNAELEEMFKKAYQG